MFEKEVQVLKFMQGYGDSLLADIAAEDFYALPYPGMNHPAWIIGHLAIAADGYTHYGGAKPQLAEWVDRFGRGTEAVADPKLYPGKDELVSAWHAANDRLITAVSTAEPSVFAEPTQGPLAEALPTVGEFLSFLMTGHTSMHLGQLSTWRRVQGQPRLF